MPTISPKLERRVVVTGVGLVTPLGLDVDSNWQSLMAGKSGIGRITHFDPAGFASQVAGEVKGFDPLAVMDAKDVKKTDRFIQLGIAASAEAVKMAGLDGWSEDDKLKTGVFLGSGVGGLVEIENTKETLMERGPRRISPFFIPAILPNLLAGQVSLKFGLKGPNWCPVSACASGAHAIGLAALSIARGETDAMVAGGAEACVCPLAVGGFAAMKALSTSYNETPEKASRPFDGARDGFVIAEGSGVMVLEEYEHAKARGAEILAELVGFGETADAYHMTTPDENGEGGKRAMRAALEMAEMDAADVSYVNAHATSTPAGDVIESNSIQAVFGDGIAVSSTKGMTGHMLGAAGSVEAIYGVLALKHQKVPPTVNLETAGEGCALDYVPNAAREMKVDAVLSNSFGFGGTNASLIFKNV